MNKIFEVILLSCALGGVLLISFYQSNLEAVTAQADLDPNGTVTSGGTSNGCSGSEHTCVDDGVRTSGTPSTASDYVTLFDDSNYSEYELTTVSGVDSVSQVVINIYQQDMGNANNMHFIVSLYNNSGTQYGSSITGSNTPTPAWESYTFNQTLTQAQLDGLRVRITCQRIGGGKRESCRAFALYADVTYEVTNNSPVASGVSIDSGAGSITLTESTTTQVVCEGTVTDNDGYADISSVTADLFLTSSGIGSALNDKTHYRLIGDSECIPSGGAGNSETYTCSFDVEYDATPTDSGSPNENEEWTCTLTPSDTAGAGTASSDTIEMASLLAIITTSSISFGNLEANTNTGTSSQSANIGNTGNRVLDVELSGTDLVSGSDSISVSNQQYDLDGLSYNSATATSLTATPTTLFLALDPGLLDSVHWGIGVDNGQPTGTYTGTITYTPIANVGDPRGGEEGG